MKKLILFFIQISRRDSNKGLVMTKKMEMELKRYEETYKLLGEYDKKPIKDPRSLADPGRLREFTDRFFGYSQ